MQHPSEKLSETPHREIWLKHKAHAEKYDVKYFLDRKCSYRTPVKNFLVPLLCSEAVQACE